MKVSLRELKADAHEDSLWSAAWTAGPNLLVTGSLDETVKTWGSSASTASEGVGDGGALEETHTYTGHSLGVVCVAVDSKGLAASSALDSVIRVWDVTTNETRAVIEAPPAEVWGIALNGGTEEAATHLAAAGGAGACVNLYSIQEKQKYATFNLPSMGIESLGVGSDRFVMSVAFSADGRRVAAGAMDGSVAVWDVQGARLLQSFQGHKMPVRSLAFSPDSRTLLIGCDDSIINMFDVEHGPLMASLSGHQSWVLSVAWSPSGSGFLTGSSDRTVRVWDFAQRSCTQTLTQHTDSVWGLAFRPDGARAASVSDDKSICIYDIA
mmetsp:Transcript_15115/g.20859  ORF Transcript_15115/g.20859 Transcript_15115/m.20859 type:complete len:324 (-) Transcript_15115:225-1196(-)|eukprot:CAMPEP_0196575224 /NCGR_PEP_ID=MMETSP1081-20130531/4742_1 /TAXON_ID=36882 /ORGANISM="Pyramimonas amylifera, Strain CCMP720" /LENGTH=323 /DNA_ID=CAMNT_0041893453 /DNA_START=289 /DNA_END=1260 /DNA_ORIENTATION=+